MNWSSEKAITCCVREMPCLAKRVGQITQTIKLPAISPKEKG